MLTENFLMIFLHLRSPLVFAIFLLPVVESSRSKVHLVDHLCRKCSILLVELGNLEAASAMSFQKSRRVFYFDLSVSFRAFSRKLFSFEKFSKRRSSILFFIAT